MSTKAIVITINTKDPYVKLPYTYIIDITKLPKSVKDLLRDNNGQSFSLVTEYVNKISGKNWKDYIKGKEVNISSNTDEPIVLKAVYSYCL